MGTLFRVLRKKFSLPKKNLKLPKQKSMDTKYSKDFQRNRPGNSNKRPRPTFHAESKFITLSCSRLNQARRTGTPHCILPTGFCPLRRHRLGGHELTALTWIGHESGGTSYAVSSSTAWIEEALQQGGFLVELSDAVSIVHNPA